jgi:patatin-like phospholipase/acyl hydrolase
MFILKMSKNLKNFKESKIPPKYILSIDGGGSRGIIGAQFLKLLEIELQKTDPNMSLYDRFDMFAGTSTGSMLVSPIVYKKMSGSDLVHKIFTLKNIKKIFSKSWWDRIFGSVQFRPKYTAKGKRLIIEENASDLKMFETDKPCLITGYNVSEHEARFFKSYNNLLGYPDDKVFLRDAIDVSSSTPSFFPSVEYDDDGITKYGIDGGLVGLNPTDSAYADAIKLWPDEEIRILSIGLGTKKFSKKNGPDSLSWGGIQWLINGSILNRASYINPPVVNYRMKIFSRAFGHTYLRIGDEINDISVDANSEKDHIKMLEIGTDLWYKERSRVMDFFSVNNL